MPEPTTTPGPTAAGHARSAPSRRNERRFGLLLRLAGTVALLAWVLRQVDEGAVLAHFARLSAAGYIAAALLACAAQMLIASNLRWSLHRVAGQPAAAPLPRFEALRIHGLGLFANLFLPTSIGGDVVKSVALRRDADGVVSAAAAVILTRALSVPSLVLGASVGLVLCWPRLTATDGVLAPTLAAVFGGMALGLLVVWVARRPAVRVARRLCPVRLREKFNPVFDVVGQLTLAAVLPPIAISACYTVCVAVWTWWVALAMGLPLDLGVFLFATPTVFLLTLLPISIHGIGVREAAYINLLAPFAIGQEAAMALAWLALSLIVVFGLCGGLLFLLGRRAPRAVEPRG
ncbi:MAG: YbhN family protein [Planctomycetota bacterium]